MHQKKFRFFAVLLVCLSAAALFAACGDGAKLLDFKDETVECEYASVYELDLSPAKDKKGNEYAVYGEVKDTDGSRVAVFDGKFDIADIRGYIITYTARSEQKTIGERTVTVTVNKTVKPTVLFSAIPKQTYELDAPFHLPSYSAHSPLTDSVTTSSTLYYMGDTERVVPVTEGVFIPDAAGEYEYRVTASDEFGNQTAVPFRFSIRTAPAAGEVESFDAFASAFNTFTPDNRDLGMDYIGYTDETVKGVTGSLKMKVSASWPGLYIRPRQSVFTDEEYRFISFKLYVDPAGIPEGRRKTVTVRFPGQDIAHNQLVVPGEWTEIYLSSEEFIDSADENGFCYLFAFNNDDWEGGGDLRKKDAFTCYLYDVQAVKRNVPKTESQIVDLSSPTVLQNVHSKYQYAYDFGFDFSLTNEAVGGRSGDKLKLTNTNVNANYPAFCIKPAREKAFYTEKGYTHILVSLYAEGETMVNSGLSKSVVFFLRTGIEPRTEILPADRWASVAVPLDDFFGAADGEGYVWLFNVINNDEGISLQDPGLVMYVGGIDAIKAQDGEGTKLLRFDGASVYANLRADGITAIEPADTHPAVSAVCTDEEIGGNTDEKLLIAGPARFPRLSIKPPCALADYKSLDKDSVRFSVYAPSASLADGQTSLQVTLIDGTLASLVPDTWTAFDVGVDYLYENIGADGFAALLSFENRSGNTELYLTEPELVKAYAAERLDAVTAATGDMLYSRVHGSVAGTESPVKLTVPVSWSIYWVKPLRDEAYYNNLGLTHLSVRLYLDSATMTGSTENGYKRIDFFFDKEELRCELLPFDRWVEVTLPIRDFFKNADESGRVQLFWILNHNEAGYTTDADCVIYVDEIRAVKSDSVLSPYGQDVYCKNMNTRLSAYYTEKMTVAKHYSQVDGTADSVKITVEGGNQDALKLLITPAAPKQLYTDAGFTHVKVRLYIDSSTLTEGSKASGSKPVYMFKRTLEHAPLDKWVEFTYTLDEFYSGLDANNTVLLFTFYNFDWTEGGQQLYFADPDFVLYLDSVRAVKID